MVDLLLSVPRNASYVKESDFTYVIVSIVFAVFSILTNFVVLVAFYVQRSSKRKTIRSYVVSMAIADFIYGAFSVPLSILSSVGLPREEQGWCSLHTAFQIMSVGFSIMALLATVEMQFIGVIFPVFYQMYWNDEVVKCHILCHWIFGVLIGSPVLFQENMDDTCYYLEIVPKNITLLVTFGMVLPAAAIMILVYLAIYLTFIKTMTQRFTTLGVLPVKSGASSSVSIHVRTSAVIFLNVLLFLVCWLPLYIIDTINVFDETFTANVHVINALIVMRCARCAINPFLYAYHIPEVKTIFNDIQRCVKCNMMGEIKRDRSISTQTIVTKL